MSLINVEPKEEAYKATTCNKFPLKEAINLVVFPLGLPNQASVITLAVINREIDFLIQWKIRFVKRQGGTYTHGPLYKLQNMALY